MIAYENCIKRLMEMLQKSLGKRLVYVGLQGNYLHGESKVKSDLVIIRYRMNGRFLMCMGKSKEFT